ncbi:hypothetical protein CA13_34850 [Planctomycetes bacterium CA13]|uniref:Uncharacterized protein n=1 Tax=Novipirellula herctigrandis TaxID=2527986 RepID=A0A5C5Z4B8_9BACT|nr:hypothetical protein CA13_34850 [Planctomycetes bacterium CA13]
MPKSSKRNSNRNAPPRPRGSYSILFGFLLLLWGTTLAITSGIPIGHRSLAMKASPREVDYATLIKEGLADNAHVHLTNVNFDRNEKASQLEQIAKSLSKVSDLGSLSSDPEEVKRRVAAMQKDLAGSIDPAQIGKILADSFEPIKLYPQDANPTSLPHELSLIRTSNAVAMAAKQIDSFNKLRGYLTIDTTGQSRQTISMLTKPGAMDRDATAWVETLQELQASSTDSPVSYIIEPMNEPPSRVYAMGRLLVSLLSILIGWLLIGSGTPSWLGWIFMPIPSLIALVGFPLRQGRGGRKTSMLYMIIGLMMVILGGYEMFVEGHFARVGGNSLHQVFGFLIGTTGLAAVVASRLHCRACQPLENILPPPSVAEPSERKVLSYRSSFDQAQDNLAGRDNTKEPMIYSDPRLIATMDDSCSTIIIDAVERLATISFSNPSYVRPSDDFNVSAIALQFGCDHKVLAEISDKGPEPMIRFTSVLHDGLAIITVTDNIDRTRRPQFGDNGIYQTGKLDLIEELLANHLQQTIRMSDKRDATVVTFGHEEKLEVCLYSRRVFTDVQRQFNGTKIEVGTANYDRFQFPPQQIEELAEIA